MNTATKLKDRDAGKLDRLLGLLDGTIASVCNYSAEALIDRMKYMAAFIRNDENGIEKFGKLCAKEREGHVSQEGA
jgi:hypothetical protein